MTNISKSDTFKIIYVDLSIPIIEENANEKQLWFSDLFSRKWINKSSSKSFFLIKNIPFWLYLLL